MRTNAERVIAKCGGVRAVAAIMGVDVSTVHRWTYPKDRGGTDGQIPTKHQQPLLDRARAAGIDLRPDDFFGLPDDAETTAEDAEPEDEAA